MSKILIGPSSFGASDRTPVEHLLRAGYSIQDNPYKRKLTKSELLTLLTPDVVGLIAGLELLDEEVLKKSKLKVISRVGSGLSNIDLATAKELKIKVCYTPDGPTNAVAELTIGMMITTCRMAYQMNEKLRQGEWHKLTGFELKGKTIVIVGFGKIGRRVAKLLAPFNVHLIVVDPFLKEKPKPVEILSLEEALPMADIITLHASGDGELLGKKQFCSLKKGVVLLNPARGGLINERALIRALENKTIASAWLDTFIEEPYQGLLTKFPQVILTPHIGSYSRQCRLNMETQAVKNLLESLD